MWYNKFCKIVKKRKEVKEFQRKAAQDNLKKNKKVLDKLKKMWYNKFCKIVERKEKASKPAQDIFKKNKKSAWQTQKNVI